jgi:hypothetical protein
MKGATFFTFSHRKPEPFPLECRQREHGRILRGEEVSIKKLLPTAEDGGLAGTDPVAGKSLSQSKYLRERVCDDPSEAIMIPERQLTQVVEFYDRGGDFNTFGEEHQYMDADIDNLGLGLTLQDKTDLIDFIQAGAISAPAFFFR